ncbi:MAG: gamma carbonic anhydrase family protein [Deltaproteobacteria bacterium]|nr:gamma carbonic anhydrase family protein [Deltaproteobacteria bacterium]
MSPPQIGSAFTQVHPSAFIATGAVVVGDVHLEKDSSVWFNAVLRGDVEGVRVGPLTNVQDGAILHADEGYICQLDEGVTVGHNAVLHGCHVEHHSMIGMSATILNGAVIGHESIVGSGALIPEGKTYPPRSLLIGIPAKAVRTLSDDEVQGLHASARHYAETAKAYHEKGHGISPLQDKT